MKTRRNPSLKHGFTLMELMVAMAITTIIVTVLVSITSIALDTWNRSRSELRASRQAKSMIDTLARDFESMITRRGNANEWFSAIAENQRIGGRMESTNASKLIFFTAATDRYNGQLNGADNIPNTADDPPGGDVSCVGYELQYKDPLTTGGTGNYDTFVMSRLLVNPDQTFRDLLGKPNLTTAFAQYAAQVSNPENFVCENVFQFSVTLNVQVSQVTGAGAAATTTLLNVPITLGPNAGGNSSRVFRIRGTGIEADATSAVTPAQLAAGRLTSIQLSISVISDFGIDQIRNRNFTGNQQADFLAKNSYQYSKLVQLPSM
jgi:prepilin-type N-terminal cleavage/methylation domain-containing protein